MEADDESEDETKLIILIIGAISDLRAAAAGSGGGSIEISQSSQGQNRKSRMSEYTNNANVAGAVLWVMY